MSNSLFEQFQTTTAAAWKQKIQVDLKGADYNDTLLWKSDEGITVKPFYTKEDRKGTSSSEKEFNFNISQSIFINDPTIANTIATNALKKGANAIEFIATEKFNYQTVFNSIDLSKTLIYLRFQFLDTTFINEVHNYLDSENCYIQVDIINKLAGTGNWFENINNDFSNFKSIVNNCTNSIGIDSTLYQNAGATITQQLAYTLAHANEYLNHFEQDDISAKFHFTFAMGSNYFFEIAKLKAFKQLWELLLKEYNYSTDHVHIFAQPSLRNKTIYDYNTNMLRTTSECMSAILGGATTVNNLSYDAVYHKKNEFGERIARNQLLILQQESALESANTVVNGSYYIENLTHQFAEKALSIFKTIEQGGGFLKQLKDGKIQKKIEESATQEQEKFDNQEIVLLGTNKLSNQNDKMQEEIEFYPFVKTNIIKTLIPPIINKRLSENYESNRLKEEK
jgi:methylmalonyl-CoA mutase